MQDDFTVQIPLYAQGGQIAAYATVDAADAEFANRWRWRVSMGYARRSQLIDGVKCAIYLHRELLGLVRGDGVKADHIDRNRLNCRRNNLRIATIAQNNQNVSSIKNKTSIYRGVFWYEARKKWIAAINVNGERVYLGRFSDELEAARVAKEARLSAMRYAID